MRFLTTAILTISLAAATSSFAQAQENEAKPAEATQTARQDGASSSAQSGASNESKRQETSRASDGKKASRGKRFLRSMGSVSTGLIVTDPYSDSQGGRKSAR